jgi:hypothetical protein
MVRVGALDSSTHARVMRSSQFQDDQKGRPCEGVYPVTASKRAVDAATPLNGAIHLCDWMDTSRLRLFALFHLHDFHTAVVTAVRADPVGQSEFVAVRAGHQFGPADTVMAASISSSRAGYLTFR